MDDEDFLAAVEADNLNLPVEEPREPVTEPAVQPEPEAAPAEPVPEPANPFATPVVEAKPEPGFVPITSMLDEREKRQKLEAELAQIRASQQQQQPQPIPDRWEDPDGHDAYQQALAERAITNVKLDLSEEVAREKFGDELVDKAREWALQKARTHPSFGQELLQQRNPYRYAVEQYNREQIASQVSPDDFAQFQAWKQAQAQLQAPAPAAEPAPPDTPRTLPPRSLASAPSAGGVLSEVEQSEEEMFAEVIPKR